ncbi:MAG: DegV family protein [Thomasclavelia sp.]|jgi:DegV family protein with EDD domain|nr:DegV family protein [Thomasclavelia sp.]
MPKVAIITDSNSGITPAVAKELGCFVLPMPFEIDGQTYYEEVNLSQDEFYNKLMNNAEVFTSQPVVGDISKLWNEVLKTYDEIVHIPMSSGLSGSCQTALMLAEEYDGKVEVANTQRISVTQEQDVLDALAYAKAGKSAKEIKDLLEDHKMNASIYITVNTLEYLAKGGRLTPAVAKLGGMLKIKPILTIQGEKLDTFSKSRTMTKAGKIMIDAIKKDIKNRFDDDPSSVQLNVAYTYDLDAALEYKKEVEEAFPGQQVNVAPLSLSVSCHIGPNSLALAIAKKYN